MFCTHREVLRLPPFPLSRLELECLDPPQATVALAAATAAATAATAAAASAPEQQEGSGGEHVDQKAACAARQLEAGSDSTMAPTAGSCSALLRDLHLCMLRILEGLDVEPQQAPSMAGYGSAAELGPQDVYRCLKLCHMVN